MNSIISLFQRNPFVTFIDTKDVVIVMYLYSSLVTSLLLLGPTFPTGYANPTEQDEAIQRSHVKQVAIIGKHL